MGTTVPKVQDDADDLRSPVQNIKKDLQSPLEQYFMASIYDSLGVLLTIFGNLELFELKGRLLQLLI